MKVYKTKRIVNVFARKMCFFLNVYVFIDVKKSGVLILLYENDSTKSAQETDLVTFSLLSY